MSKNLSGQYTVQNLLLNIVATILSHTNRSASTPVRIVEIDFCSIVWNATAHSGA